MKILIILILLFQTVNLNAQKNLYKDMDLYNLGLKYLDSAKYDMAVQNFSKAIDLNPGNTIYFYKRGHTYYNMGSYDLAISDFAHCSEVLPDEAEYHYLVGMCNEK